MSRLRTATLSITLVLWLTPAAAWAVLVISPSGQPFDFSHQVHNPWSAQCSGYTYWTTPWFVQGPECDRIVLANATGLAQLGYVLMDATGTPVQGTVLVSGGLVLQTPAQPPVLLADGFHMLSLLDETGDGQLDPGDSTWVHLSLFADENGDAVLDPGEQESMGSVTSLGTIGGATYLDPLGNQRSDGSWTDLVGLPMPATDVEFASLVPQSFGGLFHFALGAASISNGGGTLSVSNLGSSGCDGVSIELGQSLGAMVDLDLIPPDVECVLRWRDPLKLTPGHMVTILRPYRVRVTAPEPGMASGRLVVLSAGSVVATTNAYAYGVEELIVGDNPDEAGVTIDHGESSVGAYPTVRSTVAELRWDAPVTIDAPSLGGPVVGDHVRIVPMDATVAVDAMCSLELVGESANPADVLDLGPPALAYFGQQIVSAGAAELVSQGNSVAITNLGALGQDGVDVWKLPPLPKNTRYRLPFSVWSATPTAAQVLLARSSAGGVPPSTAGTLVVTGTPANEGDITWDFSPIQSTTATVEVWDDGTLVSSVPGFSGGIVASTDERPVGLGLATGASSTALGFVLEWPRALDVSVVIGPVLAVGDQVRIVAEGGQAADVSSLRLTASNVPGDTLELVGIPASLAGDAALDITAIEAVGQASLRERRILPLERVIRVHNLRSEGGDGVGHVLDLAAAHRAVETELGHGGSTTTGNVLVSYHTGGGRALAAEESLTASLTDGAIHVTGNLTALGGSNPRIRVWLNGVVQTEQPIDPSSGDDFSVPVWPSSTGGEFRVAGAGAEHVASSTLPGVFPVTFTPAGPGKLATTVSGDLVQVVRDLPTMPDVLSYVEILAEDLPYLDVRLIPGGSPPTAAPLPSMMADQLLPNAPNPFNPRTTLSFSLAQSGPVELAVFGIDGRRVKVLVDSRLDAGSHRQTWDGTDASGQAVASGVYFGVLRTDGGVRAQKLVLAK